MYTAVNTVESNQPKIQKALILMDTISLSSINELEKIHDDACNEYRYKEMQREAVGSFGYRVTQRIQQRLFSGEMIGSPELKHLMKLLGQSSGLAISSGIELAAIENMQFKAELVSRIYVPDLDAPIRRAAEIFFEQSGLLSKREKYNDSAIGATNGAMKLTVLYDPTPEDLRRALSEFNRARNMKRNHGDKTDLAFSDFNIGKCYIRLAEICNGLDCLEYYRSAWRTLRAAIEVLQENRATERIDWSALCQNVADCASQWTRAYEKVIADGSVVRRRLVPTDEDLDFATAMIDEFVLSGASWREEVELKWYRWKVEVRALHGNIPNADVYRYLGMLWDEAWYSKYLQVAIDFIGLGDIAKSEYRSMICRIIDAVDYYRTNRDAPDVERFLTDRATDIRMAGIEAAFMGEFEFAFYGMELSKGLILSGELDVSRMRSDYPDGVTIVQIGQSPRGISCVIRRPNDVDSSAASFAGRSFAIPDMRTFNELFVEIDDTEIGGFFVNQTRRDSRDNLSKIDEIIDHLVPVADYILKATTREEIISFVASGFVQALPLQSISDSRGVVLESVRSVSCSPAAFALTTSSNDAEPHRFAAVLADDPGGGNPLEFSKLEVAFLRSTQREVVLVPPTSVDLRGSLSGTGHVHYSGHSLSDWNPLRSHFKLNDADLCVADILSEEINIGSAVLNSCQSGMSQNLMLSEESLSLQSSLFLKGARWVIGTVWPVADRVGLVFSFLFYRQVSVDSDSVEIMTAVSAAKNGIRNMTVGEFNSIIDYLGGEESLKFSSLPETALPFNHFYLWAPFVLMSR